MDDTRRRTSLVDLSHRIHTGMAMPTGLPAPVITDHLGREQSRSRYAPGTEFHIGQITMVANTGTCVDTAAHRFASGADLAGTPLAQLADLPGVVVRIPVGTTAIDRHRLARYRVAGFAVLLHTGWDRNWGSHVYSAGGHPYLTLDGAAHLAQQGARLVGIDAVSVDDFADLTRPAHTTLLGQGIPIVEHLRGLDQLPPDGFRFHAAPPMVLGLGSFPVRAYAVVDAG